MKLNYQEKEEIMQKMFVMHNSPIGFRSVYKGIPIYNYEGIKQFIDFTKYFVMFRGPRMRGANSTRKCDAYAFDVYERDARDVREIRIERESFLRGVEYGRKLNGN
jgi:hypothetical protein